MLRREGYVVAPTGLAEDFRRLLEEAVLGVDVRTSEGARRTIARCKGVRASFALLYGAREVRGSAPEMMVPRAVSDAYVFVLGLERSIEIPGVRMHRKDPIVAARLAFRDPTFAEQTKAAFALGGKRAVRELLGVVFTDALG